MEQQWGVIVVEDEPVTQGFISSIVESDEDFALICACESVSASVKVIQESRPDLLLLDVQLSDGTSFNLLEQISSENRPHIIFVTAYDQYAIQAFEKQAIDYVLKPFGRARLLEALERAKVQLKQGAHNRAWDLLLEIVRKRSQGEENELIALKIDGKTFLKKIDEIDWIEASEHGVTFHMGRNVFPQRDTLISLEARLSDRSFVRTHKSTIVNLARIDKIEPWFHGDYVIFLKDGTRLKLSRRYKEKLESKLDSKL